MLKQSSHSPEFIELLLSLWQKSIDTIPAFCSKYEVSERNFRNWLKGNFNDQVYMLPIVLQETPEGSK